MQAAAAAVTATERRINFRDRPTLALVSAWLLALTASLAVLFIGEIMGQLPCVLCWYQRIAMFPLALILAVAVWRGDLGAWRYGLPVALAGALVAAFHVLLYFGVIPESIVPCGTGPSCTDAQMTIFGLALPVLSLGTFLGLAILLWLVRKGARHG